MKKESLGKAQHNEIQKLYLYGIHEKFTSGVQYGNEWNDNKYYVQYVYMLGIVRMVTLLQFMLSSDHSAAITMADVAVGDK